MSLGRNGRTSTGKIVFILAAVILIAGVAAFFLIRHWSSNGANSREPLRFAATLAGINGEIGEPYGVAVLGGAAYVSDGDADKIFRIDATSLVPIASGLNTPSAIAAAPDGTLVVADTGSNTVKRVDKAGNVSMIAGTDGRSGDADGPAASALFNAPIGVAVGEKGVIYVADTYNDRIRMIRDGQVSTLAGGVKGSADGVGKDARFDTPCGVAVLDGKVLVADTGNGRIRVVEPDGRTWTLIGTKPERTVDGDLAAALSYRPTSIALSPSGDLYFTDGNSIRVIVSAPFPVVKTLSATRQGLADGEIARARFNRPSGLAFDASGRLIVADSENRLVRQIASTSDGHALTHDEVVELRDKPEIFRQAAAGRWPYDPPSAKREVAGTLGEIRGNVRPGNDDIHFHNGLDIAGAYGETARFVRDEKVLRPFAVDNFAGLSESLRMPTMGYIHVRLGRDQSQKPLGDPRFQFFDENGKMAGVRVPRGSRFKAGEPIGTLNTFNHVHLIAGRSGSEMNALDALILPGISDTRPPTIESVSLYDEAWNAVDASRQPVKLSGRYRIVVRAYDQVDGNSERRRLGLYKIGYELQKADGTPVGEPLWDISFARLPDPDSIRLVYANGSQSGATGETIFNYIATDRVAGDDFHEAFFDTSTLEPGTYKLVAMVADQSGNVTSKDVNIQITR